ncbi:MAG: class I SAM-dependent methyltransferase [Candidatus Abyssubacteria bacterium]
MSTDVRRDWAKYYDLLPVPFNDIDFYKARIPSPDASVLELGCGTGRVLIPLAAHCGFIYGVDRSEAMLAICREKLKVAGLLRGRALVKEGDIADLKLDRKFDLIIAPYRVFQNLETEEQISGLFRTVRQHLFPSGTCILNVFNPYHSKEKMATDWVVEGETLAWELPVESGRIALYEKAQRIDPERQIIYPELTFRRFSEGVLVDEAVLKLTMCYYYPDQFEALILKHGFTIMNTWGGYSGEPYGEGTELVIEFRQ